MSHSKLELQIIYIEGMQFYVPNSKMAQPKLFVPKVYPLYVHGSIFWHNIEFYNLEWHRLLNSFTPRTVYFRKKNSDSQMKAVFYQIFYFILSRWRTPYAAVWCAKYVYLSSKTSLGLSDILKFICTLSNSSSYVILYIRAYFKIK